MNDAKGLKILIIPYFLCKVVSYVNMCIGIAQNLHKRGHRIIFAINEEWRGKCVSYGFEEIVMSIDGNGNDNDVYEFYEKRGLLESSQSPLEKMISACSSNGLGKYVAYDDIIAKIIDRVSPDIIINGNNYYVIPSIMKSGRPWVLAVGTHPLQFIEDERTPPTCSGVI